MKNKFTFILTIVLLLGSYFALEAQTAFSPKLYVAITKPGMNTAAKNYTIYTSSSPSSGYTSTVSFTPSQDINGMGLNPVDNFVYGAAFIGAQSASTDIDVALYRIGADGNYVDLGLLPLIGNDPMRLVNYNGGTVSQDGKYYYIAIGVKSSGLSKFVSGNINQITTEDIDFYIAWVDDVSSLPANSGNKITNTGGSFLLDVSDPSVKAAYNQYLQAMLASYPNVQDADGGIQDLAISPVNTNIYGYITYPDGNGNTVGRPVRIAPPASGGLTVPVTIVGTTINTQPGVEMDGVTFDENNIFYGFFVNGDFTQIDLTTGAISALTPSGFTTASGNLRGDLTGYVTSIALPVKLADFSLEAIGNTVRLNWITESESGNAGFDIQHSTNGINWRKIGFVSSYANNGNSTAPIHYKFTDTHPIDGKNYYRLKQIDKEGKSHFSDIKNISLDTVAKVRLYPNPATTILYVQSNSIKTVQILNVAGKTVYKEETVTNNAVNVSSLPAGIYFAKIILTDGSIITQKVIIKK